METAYDICIIGAGMIGSAAARHVTEISPNCRVCIIGPEEPKERSQDDRRTIFGAYYDVGRITRQIDDDFVWSTLAKRSINRYRDLERQAGIAFYDDVGCLSVMGELTESETANAVWTSGHNVSIGKWSEIKSKYNLGYFNFDAENDAVLEHGFSGHVNPRLLVEAQLLAARKRGCDVIRDVVMNIEEMSQDGTRALEVTTESRRKVYAKRVLLATGAFASFRNLFPQGIKPNLDLKKGFVLLAEVKEEERSRFWRMPCLGYHPKRMTGRSCACYTMPPLQYPDGKYYIKMGPGDQYDFPISTETEVKEWYSSRPSDDQRCEMVKLMKEILPDFEPVSIRTDTCVVARTPSGRPYIDMVTPRLGVALGGNGHAAKSSDEIGRLAADMIVHGKFLDPDLQAEYFKFQVVSRL